MNSRFLFLTLGFVCGIWSRGADLDVAIKSPGALQMIDNKNSMGAIYSPDGRYILYASQVNDFVSASSFYFNVFVSDTLGGSVRLVSVAQNGAASNGPSEPGGISADNRLVVFQSAANNLAAGDTNLFNDIYLRDLQQGATELISFNHVTGASGNGPSRYPQISRDGRWVAFESNANNLGAADINTVADIYVWDRQAQTMQCASGGNLSTTISDFVLSDDSRFLLYSAAAPAGSSGAVRIYLRDLVNGGTRWVDSALTNLAPGFVSTNCVNPLISSDSRYVFFSAATRTANASGIVRVDLTDNTALLIATNADDGPFIRSQPRSFDISDDGQSCAYVRGTNVWFWRVGAATNELVLGANKASSATPVMSHNGRYLTFLTDWSETPGVPNSGNRLYMRDLQGTNLLVGYFPFPDYGVASPSFSPDDATVLFESTIAASSPSKRYNGAIDLLAWPRESETLKLASSNSLTSAALFTNGPKSVLRGGINGNGRFIAFTTTATLSSNDTNLLTDVYVSDRILKTNILVSSGTNGFTFSTGAAGSAFVSRDGQRVFFESSVKGLAGAGDSRADTSIYMRNLSDGSISNVILPAVTGSCTLRGISEDGRFVFYTKTSTALYRYDVLAQTNAAYTISASTNFWISADGQRVIPQGSGSQLIDFTVTNSPIVLPRTFAFSSDGNVAVVSPGRIIDFTKAITNNVPFTMVSANLSANGRILAAEGKATVDGKLISVITSLDRLTGKTNLVSKGLAGAMPNGDSLGQVISSDGRFIAFESLASNLVPNDNNGFKDVFLYDRLLDRLTLASHAAGKLFGGNAASFKAAFSGDGATLFFSSAASDLSSEDNDDQVDVYSMALDISTPTDDTDGDGLPDAWERANFNTLDFSGADDPDGDGISNSAEFQAGTDPMDATSAFRIVQLNRVGDGSLNLQWIGVAGHDYQLEMRASLTAGDWALFGNVITATSSQSMSVDLPAGNEGYFRLRLVR